MRLAGEVALVTGSTAGIGRVLAERFVAEGARVVVTGRDADRGAAVVYDVAARGGEATFISADLTDAAACDALVEESVERFGTVTVLVNDAVADSQGRDGPVTEVTRDVWDAILAVNLVAAATLSARVIPHMARTGHGSIVNVSSRAAVRASPGNAAYIASKGALEALTRAIAVDHARDGVRCNTLRLGYVLNHRRDADLDDEARARLEAMHLTRLATADDVAHAAVYLASAESAVVTGSVLDLDGGSTAARGRVLG